LGSKCDADSQPSTSQGQNEARAIEMTEPKILFDDGAAYERVMGVWSALAGNVFLDWLSPAQGMSWVDVGCGNGAFTELIVDRCQPARVHGIDPSEAQLVFARQRNTSSVVEFQIGDALALPYANASFDAAIMALVIFFVPEPAKGVAEMVRVVKSGGTVATYAWDILGGGLPYAPVGVELRGLGVTMPMPPSPGASLMPNLRKLWTSAGLIAVEVLEITVQRTFADFDDFWITTELAFAGTFANMAPHDVNLVKERVRARLPADDDGHITYGARVNAIKGQVR